MNLVERVTALTKNAASFLGEGDPQELPVANLQAAGELLEECYRLMPDQGGVLFNLGNIRDELSLAKGGPFVSMELYERSLAKRVIPGALLNKARILDLQENRHFEALELYRQATIQQGLFRGAIGLGTCMLMCACRLDDPATWREAWYWFEHRIGKAEMKDTVRTWRGENLNGKVLVIYTDFGLGDQMWGLRWIKKAKEAGAYTVVICGPETQRLFSAQSYIDEARVQGTGEPIGFDYITALMSMGTYMDPTSRDKAVEPYLDVPRYAAVITERPNAKRVGLAWQGSVTRGYPSWRNVPIEKLFQHLPLDAGIDYVSLQKGGGANLAPWHQGQMDWESIKDCKDLLDTARLICSCDLVVTIGSLMSMLAPALGVPTWLLNTHNSAWQFGPNDAMVSWFHRPHAVPNPGFRFCQRTQGDWTEPLRDLASQLREWAVR